MYNQLVISVEASGQLRQGRWRCWCGVFHLKVGSHRSEVSFFLHDGRSHGSDEQVAVVHNCKVSQNFVGVLAFGKVACFSSATEVPYDYFLRQWYFLSLILHSNFTPFDMQFVGEDSSGKPHAFNCISFKEVNSHGWSEDGAKVQSEGSVTREGGDLKKDITFLLVQSAFSFRAHSSHQHGPVAVSQKADTLWPGA